jgi:hypothetical protein
MEHEGYVSLEVNESTLSDPLAIQKEMKPLCALCRDIGNWQWNVHVERVEEMKPLRGLCRGSLIVNWFLREAYLSVDP